MTYNFDFEENDPYNNVNQFSTPIGKKQTVGDNSKGKTMFNPAVGKPHPQAQVKRDDRQTHERDSKAKSVDDLPEFVDFHQKSKSFDPSKPYDPDEEIPLLEGKIQ